MDKVTIRRFKKNHLTQVESLLKGHPDIFSKNDFTELNDNLREYVLLPYHRSDEWLTLASIKNKVLCGLIMYQKDSNAHKTYNIKWLVVAKEEEHKGYGSRLMNEVFKQLRECGGKHIYLETSNEKHNEHAKKFYEKHGFKKIGVLPDYFDPPVEHPRKLEDAIIFHKEL